MNDTNDKVQVNATVHQDRMTDNKWVISIDTPNGHKAHLTDRFDSCVQAQDACVYRYGFTLHDKEGRQLGF